MSLVEQLIALIVRYMPEDGTVSTAIPRLSLIRASQPNKPVHMLHEPALCLVVQGKKEVFLADQLYSYDRDQYLIVAVDLPITGQIIEATPASPYLCLRLDFDLAILNDLMSDIGLDVAANKKTEPGLIVSPATPELLSAAVRLVELLFAPRDIDILATLIEREILYRLLTGAQTRSVQQIVVTDSKLQQVNRAISLIKEHYREPLSIDTLASAARMSPSALHQHFKIVTASSPLQYQKRLRLQEARRLMVSQGLRAADASFIVGYESPSQFSREYRRIFGVPPSQDVRTTS